MEAGQRKATRGRLLGAAGITGAAIAAGSWRPESAGAAPTATRADRRSYTGGRFALDLEGKSVGAIASAEGGTAVGEVVYEPSGGSAFQKKHIGNVKYEEISLQFGLSMGTPLWDWIQASLDGKHERKSGAFQAGDFEYKEFRSVAFQDALISAVSVPTLDAAAKETGYLTVGIAPGSTKQTWGGNATLPAERKQKAWLVNNFRLELTGVETRRVRKIDSFTIKQTPAPSNEGEQRFPQHEPGKLEFPNLAISFPVADVASWVAWYEDFVVRGANSAAAEKTGAIVFLAANGRDELARLDLFGVGIVKLDLDGSESEGASLHMRAELYCERMSLRVAGGQANG